MGIDAAGSDPLWVECTSAGAAVEATAVAELSHASDGEQALAFPLALATGGGSAEGATPGRVDGDADWGADGAPGWDCT